MAPTQSWVVLLAALALRLPPASGDFTGAHYGLVSHSKLLGDFLRQSPVETYALSSMFYLTLCTVVTIVYIVDSNTYEVLLLVGPAPGDLITFGLGFVSTQPNGSSSWLQSQGKPTCQWAGITCHAQTWSLNLSNTGLAGDQTQLELPYEQATSGVLFRTVSVYAGCFPYLCSTALL